MTTLSQAITGGGQEERNRHHKHIDHTWVAPPCRQPPPGLYQAYQALERPSHRHLKREIMLSMTSTGCMYTCNSVNAVIACSHNEQTKYKWRRIKYKNAEHNSQVVNEVQQQGLNNNYQKGKCKLIKIISREVQKRNTRMAKNDDCHIQYETHKRPPAHRGF